MMKPLPVVPGATVRVAELGVSAVTDANGVVRFVLPLGPKGERIYTFVVSTPQSPHRSTSRQLINRAYTGFVAFYSPNEDINMESVYPKRTD